MNMKSLNGTLRRDNEEAINVDMENQEIRLNTEEGKQYYGGDIISLIEKDLENYTSTEAYILTINTILNILNHMLMIVSAYNFHFHMYYMLKNNLALIMSTWKIYIAFIIVYYFS
ncbi:hypothetical protein COBT_003580 [Conglomerata obtusa]